MIVCRPLRIRLGTVLVDGPSMQPALRTGDCLLVAYGARVRPRDLVVARPWLRPELLVVKRAVAPVAGGWLVESDNPAVRGRGWTGGEADVLGRVLLRYRQGPVEVPGSQSPGSQSPGSQPPASEA